jgi:hypothetical protein
MEMADDVALRPNPEVALFVVPISRVEWPMQTSGSICRREIATNRLRDYVLFSEVQR